MNRKGNGWDNAGIESGHHVLTQALIFGRRFQTRVQSQAEPTRLRGDRVAVASFVPRSIMPGPLCARRARPRPGHARLDRWSVATCLADGCGSQGIGVQHSPGRPDRRARGRGVSYNSVCKLGVDVGSRSVIPCVEEEGRYRPLGIPAGESGNFITGMNSARLALPAACCGIMLREVGIVAVSRMGPKGQVVVPKRLRDRLHMGPGDRVVFDLEGDRLVLTPLPSRTASDLLGILRTAEPLDARVARLQYHEHVVKKLQTGAEEYE